MKISKIRAHKKCGHFGQTIQNQIAEKNREIFNTAVNSVLEKLSISELQYLCKKIENIPSGNLRNEKKKYLHRLVQKMVSDRRNTTPQIVDLT